MTPKVEFTQEYIKIRDIDKKTQSLCFKLIRTPLEPHERIHIAEEILQLQHDRVNYVSDVQTKAIENNIDWPSSDRS